MKTFYNPPPFPQANRPYAMAVRAGNTIYMSGLLSVDFVDGKRVIVAKGDIAEQARHIFQTMRTILRGLDADLKDVCWLQFFVADITEYRRMDPVRRELFGDKLPAATLVEVSKLAMEDALVEVNGIAVVD